MWNKWSDISHLHFPLPSRLAHHVPPNFLWSTGALKTAIVRSPPLFHPLSLYINRIKSENMNNFDKIVKFKGPKQPLITAAKILAAAGAIGYFAYNSLYSGMCFSPWLGCFIFAVCMFMCVICVAFLECVPMECFPLCVNAPRPIYLRFSMFTPRT